MKAIVYLLLSLLASPALAQDLAHGASGLAHGIPDFCAADPHATLVPAQTTRTLTGPQTFSCLGIHGEVTLEGAIAATNILVYADGSLTLADGAGVTIRNTSLDTATDPEQFGTGLIVLGKFRATGQTVRPFVRLGAEVAEGATTLLLSEPNPTGWKPGDRLILPDSRQLTKQQVPQFPFPVVRGILPGTASQSEVVTVASIAGNTVTLTQRTQFAHLGARLTDGTLTAFLPHVANQTRSIVIASESATGTRGHTLFSQRADVDLRYVEFADLGRTKATSLLDSTAFDTVGKVTHIGTNQIGRYPLHVHHLFGPVAPQSNGKQFTVIGASVHGFGRFGIALHNASFGLVQDAVVFDGHGAGIVTEDGSERDNLLDGNIIVKVNPPEMTLVSTAENPESESDPNARKGNCFWFRGNASEIRRNVCADTREGLDFSTGTQEGTACANCATLRIRLPKAPGLDTTVDANVTISTPLQTVPIAIEDNEIYSTTEFGFGLWMTAFAQYGAPPIRNLRIWHATHAAVLFKYSDASLDGCTLINEGGLEDAVVQRNSAVGNTSIPKPDSLTNCTIRGFDTALAPVGQQLGLPMEWTIRDSTIQARRGVLVTNRGEGSAGALANPIIPPDHNCGGYGTVDCPERPRVNLVNVRSLPLPGRPLATMVLENWTGEHVVIREPELRVRDYQGVAGQDFRVWFPVTNFTKEIAPCTTQHPDFPGINKLVDETPGVAYTCSIDGLPIEPPHVDTCAADASGKRAVQVAVGTWSRSVTAGNVGIVSYSLRLSRNPVTELVVKLNGVQQGPTLTGSDLRAVASSYFDAPKVSGSYPLSVEARDGTGCSDGADRPMTVTVK